MKTPHPITLINARTDAKNWDVITLIRQINILESSIALELSPDSQTLLDELTAGIDNLYIIPAFLHRFLDVCLEEQEDRSLIPEDYPLPQILEYAQKTGCFCPDLLADRRKIEGLNDFTQDELVIFCKSIAYRGLANWSDRYLILSIEAIEPEPEDYDYPWLNL